MNIEQLINAKTQLIQMEATWGLWISIIICVVCILTVIATADCNDDFRIVCRALGVLMILFAGVGVLVNLYNYNTAELQAKASMANYNLVEVKTNAP